MNQTALSLTEKYALLLLARAGKISAFSTEDAVCFSACAAADLVMNGCAMIDAKGRLTENPAADSAVPSSLSPVLDFIRQESPVPFDKFVTRLSLMFSRETLNEAYSACAVSLAEKGFFAKEGKRMVLKDEQTRDRLFSEALAAAREEENGDWPLALALFRCGMLKKHFQRKEYRQVKQRMEALPRQLPEQPTFADKQLYCVNTAIHSVDKLVIMTLE